jgi:hypothetical protein
MISHKPRLACPAPELDLIGAIVSADWSAGARRQWPPSLFRGIDWAKFAAFAWQHKVRPMAATALREAGWPGVPGEVREALERDARACTLKSIRQLEMQSALGRVAAAAGIRFIAIKGLALSAHLYGDPFIREAYDFDLLVSPEDTDRMKEALRSIGLRPLVEKPPITSRQKAILGRFFHEEKFVHPETGAMVDVHHALTGNPWRIATCLDDLWRRRQYVRIGGGELPIPGDADLIRYLGAHAAAHAWERWKWAGDLMVLYGRAASLDLPDQRRMARNEGWDDLFDCALLITSAITGWDIPADLRGSVDGNANAARIARRALNLSARPLSVHEITGRIREFRLAVFRLRLRKNPRHFAHEIALLLHRPQDWYELRLSDSLIPAYYFLRPLLFIWRRIAGLGRSD